MNKPVYKHEQKFLLIASIIAALMWVMLLLVSKGIILIILPIFLLSYLFIQSGFISYLKGTGALISESQFPDLQIRVKECAAKVGMTKIPEVYILHGNGVFNAFATRFLRRDYIILLSDVLDALEDHPDAINFYIGHEMGHIDRKHILLMPFLSLGLIWPLLGAAYSRSCEYTCDLYGAACCAPGAAVQAITLLAVGAKRYKTMNVQNYVDQTAQTSGFWMSFHELVASYPWLVKRLARIAPEYMRSGMPKRNALAYIPALFVPRLTIQSLAIIYLLIFFGVSSVAQKSLSYQKMAEELETSTMYDNTQNSVDQPTDEGTAQTETYTVGETYPGDDGIMFRYLGGDPSADSSWELVQ